MPAGVLLVAALASACASPAQTATPPPVVELALRTVESAGCDGALLPDVTLDVDLRQRERIVAVSANGTRSPLVFRAGTRAWLETATGALDIRLPEGDRLVVPPGESVSFGGGGMAEGDPAFFACSLVR